MENAAFWERMYAANIGRMIGLCHRYVNDLALAEDLAHEAFLKAMERADTYRATGRFEAWLMRITVNHAIQHLRQGMATVPFVDEETPDVPMEEASIWETDFTQEELLKTVQQLPIPQRTVFNLYAIDGQSHAYIADLLNISIASSKETLYRARKRLRQLLTQMAQEKEKRKKGVFVMILLFLLQHSEAARTDRMFRNRLASLAYAPAKPLTTTKIRQAAAEAPSSAGVFVAAHRAALTTAAIAGVAGGVCAWQIARTSLDNSPLQKPVAPAESSVSLPADTIAENSLQSASNSTTLENVVPYTIVESSLQTEPGSTTKPSEATVPVKQQESATKPQIIVVTKEIVVNDTVIVRDTAIVKDTVYLMQKP